MSSKNSEGGIGRLRAEILLLLVDQGIDNTKQKVLTDQIVGLFAKRLLGVEFSEERTLFEDEKKGFEIRRANYNEDFLKRFDQNPGYAYYYTVRDFLNEVWGDLVLTESLGNGVMKSADNVLYKKLDNFICGRKTRKNGYPLQVSGLLSIYAEPVSKILEKSKNLQEFVSRVSDRETKSTQREGKV